MKAVGVMLTLSVSLGCCWELVVAQDGGAAPSPLPLTLHETCREIGAVFQSGNLSCAQCAASSEPALDGLSCECLGNATRAAGDVSSSSPSCSPCPSGQAVSGDGLYCVECTPPLTFDPSTQSCSPCPSKLFIYLDTHPSLSGYPGNRTCVLCPPGTWIDQSGFSCAECGLGNCSQCLEPHNGRCFPSPLPSPPSDSFNYYTQHFTAAVGLCRYGNQEACQRLINLCVLQKYLKWFLCLRSDPACAEVLASSSSSSFLPPLYYPSRGADELLADVSFSDSLYTSPHSQGVSRLPLMVALFALNGSFLGLHDVSQQLLICRDLPPRYQDAWKVGVQYEVDCLVGVASLSSSHLTFLDLYWRDRSDVLHSVPALPRDYVEAESGEGVNRGDERGTWQLVTRFFLSEAVSSAPRYAHYITLRMRLDSGGRVLTPYLIVDYVEWERDPQSTDSLRAGFAVDYSQDVSSFNITMSVFVVVMAILVGVACGLRLNSFLRRTGDLCCTVPAYVFTVVEFSGLMSSCLFLLLSISSTVILILYKGQTLFVYTLPTGSQLLVFQIMLPLTLLGRLISVVHTIWGQCNIDIFLIDWERPSTARQQPTNQIAGHQPPVGGMVSIWRTYFVANEWNELQTLRRGLRPLSTLIAGLLFLQVIGLRHLAESDPTGHVTTSSWRYSAPHSPLLRFSLTSLVFTALAVSMRLYVVLFHERFVEDKIHQFIDLCSVSNVSVFIMWRRCYGYYIEGRSVHGQADVNMREMSDNLQKEQEDMCGRRGLMPNSDLQTFQIALTRQFRMQYDRILTPLRTEIPEGRDQLRGEDNMPHPLTERGGVLETRIAAYEQMNSFLTAFISHNLQGTDYTVRTKVFLERLLDFELRGPEDRSLFYEDPSPSFPRLLFLGQEWSLWQLELLVFAFVDMLATDYVTAAVVTAVITGVVSVVRELLGRRNLANKTLVDRRFLI